VIKQYDPDAIGILFGSYYPSKKEDRGLIKIVLVWRYIP